MGCDIPPLQTDVQIDYIHTPKNAGIAKKATEMTVQATKKIANRRELLLRAENVRIIHSTLGHSTLGIVNKTKTGNDASIIARLG